MLQAGGLFCLVHVRMFLDSVSLEIQSYVMVSLCLKVSSCMFVNMEVPAVCVCVKQ